MRNRASLPQHRGRGFSQGGTPMPWNQQKSRAGGSSNDLGLDLFYIRSRHIDFRNIKFRRFRSIKPRRLDIDVNVLTTLEIESASIEDHANDYEGRDKNARDQTNSDTAGVPRQLQAWHRGRRKETRRPFRIRSEVPTPPPETRHGLSGEASGVLASGETAQPDAAD